MKRLLVLMPLIIMACGTPSPTPSPIPSSPPTMAPSPSQSPTTSPVAICIQPSDPNSHVYNPARLKVLAPCVTVTGIVKAVRSEADGDKHILVLPDPNQPDPDGGAWVNSCNATCQGGAELGYLVTEPPCVGPVSQADAVSACIGYTNPGPIPVVGDHVKVTGPWVADQDHGGWLEVHPASYEII